MLRKITRPVKGNEQNIDLICRSFRRGMLSHAYIINGETGSDAEHFADYIAAAVQCNEQHPEADMRDGKLFAPCGHCSSCIKAASGNHPDIIHVDHKKDTVISVDELREQVIDDISIKPYYGPYKIYIINDAQLMNESGQNAILKTIEEPESYGLILLLTDNADGFLQTIRSRCITLNMDPVSRMDTADALLDEDGADVVRVLESVRGSSVLDISKNAKNFDDYDGVQIIRIMRLWFRDVLVLKSTKDGSRLFFGRYINTLKSMAEDASFEGINRIILGIDEAEARLKAHVKAEAVYENLLLAIRRELKKQKERIQW